MAVAIATALLAVAVPAVETVRVTHAEARVAGALDRVETTARTLVERNDAVTDGGGGARRTITLNLPVGTYGTSGLEHLAVRPAADGNGTVVRWRVDGGDTTRRRLDDVSIRAAAGGFVRRAGGRLRVRLVLVRRGDDRVVRLSPVGAREDGV